MKIGKISRNMAATILALLFSAGIAYSIGTTQIWMGTANVTATDPLPVTCTSGCSSGGAGAVVGNGAAATAQRVTIANDSTGVVGLNAGTALVGKVGIDQTTDGTTNKVAATQATASNLNAQIVGTVADAAADAGNSVKVGCVYESTLTTYTNGQRVPCHTGSRGSLHVELWSSDGAVTPTVSGSGGDAVSNGNALLVTGARGFAFNGASWDRQLACASQIAATVTAGNTTQLVALASSQIVRVCSYQVGIATTGTFKFVYGTGSNCGTGTVDITPATTLTAGNVVAASGGASPLLRTIASNALCLTAATGNVQVFVTYAQF